MTNFSFNHNIEHSIKATQHRFQRTKMGSYEGHALPGSMFIFIGLWWLFHVALENAANLKEQGKTRRNFSNTRSWRRFPCRRLRKIPLEPLLKLIGGLIGIVAELSGIRFQLVGENSEFQKPNKFAHSTMYGFFAFSGLVEILNRYNITQFSREAEYVVFSSAFWVEGTLFAFHLHGRDMFDVRIHTLLCIVIYLAALVILLEACLPRFRRELFMARTIFVLTQGTWFLEIGYTIYGSNKWFEGAKKDLTEEELMLDTEVITVSIMWHLLGWSMLVLFCCIATNCLYKCDKLPLCCSSYGDDEESASSLNGRVLTAELDHALSDEQEILLKRDLAENNNASFGTPSNNIDEEASF